MKTATESIDVKVYDRNGAFVANTVQGKRAACAWSDEEALWRLVDKLNLPSMSRVERVAIGDDEDEANMKSRWRITPFVTPDARELDDDGSIADPEAYEPQ